MSTETVRASPTIGNGSDKASAAESAQILCDEFWSCCPLGLDGNPKSRPHRRLCPRSGNKDAVVWIHGFVGDPRETWRALAPLVHSELGETFDFHSFHYPSGVLHKASYHAAAESFVDYFRSHLKNYQRVHVVCHSTGGLVIKKAICNIANEDKQSPLLSLASIINIGVPHRGLSCLPTIGATLAPFLYAALCTCLGYVLWWLIDGGMLREATARLENWTGISVSAAWEVLALVPWYAWAVFITCTLLPLFFAAGTLYQMVRDALGRPKAYWAPFGLNRIAWELAWARWTLRKIEKKAWTMMSEASIINHNFKGEFDTVAGDLGKAAASEKEDRSLVLRRNPRVSLLPLGGHSGCLRVLSKHDEAVKTIAGLIVDAQSLRQSVLPLCQVTVGVMERLNRLLKTPTLISESGPPVAANHDERRLQPDSWLGGQRQVAEHLLGRVRALVASPDPSRPLLLTGAAGLGKSAVLRFLAQELAEDRMTDLDRAVHPAPVWFPLYRFDLSHEYAAKWEQASEPASGSRREYQKTLLCAVIEFFIHGSKEAGKMTGTLHRECITQESVRATLSEGAVVILDGVDDWLIMMAHRKPSSAITDLLAAFREEYPQSCVVLGVRQSRLTVCGDINSMEMVEVASPSQKAIVRQINREVKNPVYKEALLTQVTRHWALPATRLLCTPLIFQTAINWGQTEMPVNWLQSRGLVFENTLRQILKNSEVFSNLSIAIDHALDVLMLVGHVMYSRCLASVNEKTLVAHLRRVVASAESEMQDLNVAPSAVSADMIMHPPAPADAVLWNNPLAERQCGELVVALEKVLPHFHEVMTLSSVFIYIQDEWRPEHREWSEFLAARFLASAACMELTEEIGYRGCETRLFFLAGNIMRERFGSLKIRPAWIHRLFEKADARGLRGDSPNPRAQIPIGNMLGIIGHCQNVLSDEAGAELFSRALRHGSDSPLPSTALVELVALQNLGFRALDGDTDLRQKLYNVLDSRYPVPFDRAKRMHWWRRLVRYFVDKRNDVAVPQLHAAACAVLLKKVLGEMLSRPDPKSYFFDSWQMKHVLADAFLHVGDEHGNVDSVKETMQEVFSGLLTEAQNHPEKTLSCVTYGMCLVQAYLQGRLSDQKTAYQSVVTYYDRKPKRGSSAQKLRDQVSSYRRLPELLHIWDHCVTLVENKKRRQRFLLGSKPSDL
ncbi:MAG: hypothetical protein ACO1TE_12595 [Prosthecobacter sp.]